MRWPSSAAISAVRRIAYAREPGKLPVILGADEVVRFLEAVPSLKTRTALTTAYAAGLRASEAVGLKVADIDGSRMPIQVRHGKGARDRTVMLSPRLLAILRTYWRLARPQEGLFPGRDQGKPIEVQVLHAGLPLGNQGGRAGPARHPLHTLRQQLRQPSAGERRRHPASSRCFWATTACRRRRAIRRWRRPPLPRLIPKVLFNPASMRSPTSPSLPSVPCDLTGTLQIRFTRLIRIADGDWNQPRSALGAPGAQCTKT